MIEHPHAPGPVSGLPYSNLVVTGELVAVASQVPFGDDGYLVGAEFRDQAHRVFANLRRVLELAGCGFGDVIKVNGFLSRAEFFDEYNAYLPGVLPATLPGPHHRRLHAARAGHARAGRRPRPAAGR